MNKLTDKQERFCVEYLVDANAFQAALRAGYTKSGARDAPKWLSENPTKSHTKFKPALAARVKDLMDERKSELIADADEVLRFLTFVLRDTGEETKERLKAAELMGKRHSLFTDKTDIIGGVTVVITGADQLED